MKYVSTSNLCDIVAEWGTASIEDMTHSKQLTCFPRKNLRVNKIEEKLLIQTLTGVWCSPLFVRHLIVDLIRYKRKNKTKNTVSFLFTRIVRRRMSESRQITRCVTHTRSRVHKHILIFRPDQRNIITSSLIFRLSSVCIIFPVGRGAHTERDIEN